jgi:hypothetical protein
MYVLHFQAKGGVFNVGAVVFDNMGMIANTEKGGLVHVQSCIELLMVDEGLTNDISHLFDRNE